MLILLIYCIWQEHGVENAGKRKIEQKQWNTRPTLYWSTIEAAEIICDAAVDPGYHITIGLTILEVLPRYRIIAKGRIDSTAPTEQQVHA